PFKDRGFTLWAAWHRRSQAVSSHVWLRKQLSAIAPVLRLKGRSASALDGYLEREDIKHDGAALVSQFRRVDKHRSGHGTRPGDNRDVLFAVGLECHRRRREARPDIGLPKLLQRGVIEGSDSSV